MSLGCLLYICTLWFKATRFFLNQITRCSPESTTHLYKIRTMLDQHWADVVQMFCVCWVWGFLSDVISCRHWKTKILWHYYTRGMKYIGIDLWVVCHPDLRHIDIDLRLVCHWIPPPPPWVIYHAAEEPARVLSIDILMQHGEIINSGKTAVIHGRNQNKTNKGWHHLGNTHIWTF